MVGEAGVQADLSLRGHSIAVKATIRWDPPMTIYLPAEDPSSIAMLVSVNPDRGICGLQGWVSKKDLHRYEPIYEFDRWVRHIPWYDLHPCSP